MLRGEDAGRKEYPKGVQPERLHVMGNWDDNVKKVKRRRYALPRGPARKKNNVVHFLLRDEERLRTEAEP